TNKSHGWILYTVFLKVRNQDRKKGRHMVFARFNFGKFPGIDRVERHVSKWEWIGYVRRNFKQGPKRIISNLRQRPQGKIRGNARVIGNHPGQIGNRRTCSPAKNSEALVGVSRMYFTLRYESLQW